MRYNKSWGGWLKDMLIPELKIGNVTMDLSYYTDDDFYSDGDIESEILEMVKSDINIDAAIKSDNRWPVLYHLSPARQNLLHSFEFPNNESVLEIGGGCGAITGVLCEKFKHVTAVELSKRRAEILAHRNKEYANLNVIVGNLNNIEFNKKYDVITLIGVLEYAGRFTSGANPYKAFLEKIKALLKPQGQVIIAIENRFGLKYWAGFREDHLGTYFTGLEGYDESTGVRTFGRVELEHLLVESGFSKSKFYYPMPDYKLPTKIFSDDYPLFENEFDMMFANYDQDRVRLFDEIKVMQSIVDEKQLGFFSNSFLIFAS